MNYFCSNCRYSRFYPLSFYFGFPLSCFVFFCSLYFFLSFLFSFGWIFFSLPHACILCVFVKLYTLFYLIRVTLEILTYTYLKISIYPPSWILFIILGHLNLVPPIEICILLFLDILLYFFSHTQQYNYCVVESMLK